jgi:SsrA-binding protein
VSKKSKKSDQPKGPKGALNRRARYDYSFDSEYEAGIVLVGSEVKSLFHGKANLTDSYCRVINGELWMISMDIEPYDHASAYLPERRRDRKLLLKRKEIDTIDRKSREKGYTIVPLEVYFVRGKAKVKIGLGKGASLVDKRESIAKRETRREIERELRNRNR